MGENDDDSNNKFAFSHSIEVMDEVLKADVKSLTQDKEKQLDNIINNTDHAAEVNIINNTDHIAEVTDEVNQLELLNTMKMKAKELTKIIMEPLTQDKQTQLENIINYTDHAATDKFKIIGS
jgi:hypothetical protein